jgi:hypothetical protein
MNHLIQRSLVFCLVLGAGVYWLPGPARAAGVSPPTQCQGLATVGPPLGSGTTNASCGPPPQGSSTQLVVTEVTVIPLAGC